MSGFIVLIGVLAVVALLATPSFARAARTAAGPKSLSREVAAPIYMKYGEIKGELLPAAQADMFLKLDYLKLAGDRCKNLAVYAHKLGPAAANPNVLMRKAGGE